MKPFSHSTGWILLIVILAFTSCKKETVETPPPQAYSDPELTAEEEKVLAEASVSVTSLLDSLFDADSVPLRVVFSRPGWKQHIDSLIRFGRASILPMNKRVENDKFNLALDGTSLCYWNEKEENVRDSVSPQQPRQMAFAYVAGSRQLRTAEFSQFGNDEHRKYKLVGTDCSGLVYQLFHMNGFLELKNFSVWDERTKLVEAVLKKYDNRAELRELGTIPAHQIRTGDVIIWPHHTGICMTDGTVPIILQSNGRFISPTPAQQRDNFVFRPASNLDRKGVNAKRLSYMVSPARWTGNYSILRIFQIPEKVEVVSGDKQTAGLGQPLPQSLKVKVVDKGGDPVPGVTVKFQVVDGGGSVTWPKIVTNQDGVGTNYWKLGLVPGPIQKVEVHGVKFDGTDFSTFNSFVAYVNSGFTCPSSVTDVDGNPYNVIRIGDQCWMKENLRTTRYRNGDPITTGLNNADWKNHYAGAFAVYNDLPSNKEIYGLLYNHYAVADPRGLCPVGWHVPRHSEWVTMQNALGGEADTTVAGKMKTTTLWTSPNAAANNSSGFSALPGGLRYFDGTYYDLGVSGVWSAYSQNNSSGGYWTRYIKNNRGILFWGASSSRDGISVRCIKDE